MKSLSFSKHGLLLLIVSAMTFAACKKDAASPELADTFVAKYTGTYGANSNGSSYTLDNAPATITKKSATEVGIELSLFGVSGTLKGTAKNDTLVELPIQSFGSDRLTAIGSCVVKSGAITMKFTSNSTPTIVTFNTYIGKKQ